jgi:hypothetical protein
LNPSSSPCSAPKFFFASSSQMTELNALYSLQSGWKQRDWSNPQTNRQPTRHLEAVDCNDIGREKGEEVTDTRNRTDQSGRN